MILKKIGQRDEFKWYLLVMAYKATIDGKQVDISKKDFIAVNNRLSVQYKEEQDPEKRRKILAVLYDLDKGLFKEWRVYGEENRKDYGQEAYFWIIAALETFKPGAGSFISWLKWYVLKAQNQVKEAGQRAALQGEQVEIIAPVEECLDSFHWKRVKAKCSPSEWVLLTSRVLYGFTLPEAAEKAGLTIDQASDRYTNLLKKLRIELSNQHDPQGIKPVKQPENEDGSKWLKKNQLCQRLQITPAYLKDLLNKKRPVKQAPYYIDPRDVLEIGRIRYLETSAGGLIYPRILRKT